MRKIVLLVFAALMIAVVLVLSFGWAIPVVATLFIGALFVVPAIAAAAI